MASYVQVDNDDDFIVIDDEYQNYHLMQKYVVDSTTLPRYSAGVGGNNEQDSHGFYMCHYTFTLANVKNPVVAYKSMTSNDTYVYTVNYTENSPNNWTMRVLIQRKDNSNGGEGTLTLYVFGMPIDSYAPTNGAVLHVLDANGRVIFDSGKFPMKVVQYENFYGPWSTSAGNPVNIPIKKYRPNATYAIIPCSVCLHSTNINNVDHWVSLTRITESNPNTLVCSNFRAGRVSGSIIGPQAPDWTLDVHSFILLDVTGA